MRRHPIEHAEHRFKRGVALVVFSLLIVLVPVGLVCELIAWIINML